MPDNPALCPVTTLQECIHQTKQFREGKDGDHKNSLFITTTGGHNPAMSITITRWIKSALMKQAMTPQFLKLIR